MKAAVIYKKGDMPQYADFPEPSATSGDEVMIRVKASAIKHFDKGRTKGTHYSGTADQANAQVIGGDGVGLLADGTRVYALGVTGMIAEKAVIEKSRMVELPEGLDDATAAALPNAVAGSAMALLFRGRLQRGETVLINGATGFTGRLAVQVAKHYGAKKIIVTGRNAGSLQKLKTLGAGEVISLEQDDEQLIAQIKALHAAAPVDVIIDYLWGHPASLIFSALKGTGAFTHRVRFVSVGSVTGDKMELSAEVLRSVDLQVCGSGLGSWTKEQLSELFTRILPDMFRLAADGKLSVETVSVHLEDIETLWNTDVQDGKRLVVMI